MPVNDDKGHIDMGSNFNNHLSTQMRILNNKLTDSNNDSGKEPKYTLKVLCLDDRGFQRRIKKGKDYMAVEPITGTITVKDDHGNPCTCPKHLFGKVLVSSLDEQIVHVTEIIKIMKLNPEKSFAFCFASVMKVQIQQLPTTITFMNWRKFLGEEAIGNDHVTVIQYLERFKNALIAVSVESNK